MTAYVMKTISEGDMVKIVPATIIVRWIEYTFRLRHLERCSVTQSHAIARNRARVTMRSEAHKGFVNCELEARRAQIRSEAMSEWDGNDRL